MERNPLPTSMTYADATSSVFPSLASNPWIFFEMALDAMLLLDAAGVVSQLNPSASELFCLPAEAVVGQSLQTFWLSNAAVLVAWLQQPEPLRLELDGLIRAGDGSVREVGLVAIAQAVPPYHLLILRDRPHLLPPATASSNTQEQRYSDILNQQTEWVCRFLPNGTLTFVNRAYCQSFGKSADQLLGENFLQFIPASDQSFVGQQIQALQQLTPAHPTLIHEHRCEGSEGATGEVWQRWTNQGIFDEQGRLVEIQASGQDITTQKQLEKALQQSEIKFRTLFEILPIGLCITDPDGQFLEANPASEEILGISCEDQKKHKIDSPEWQVVAADGTCLAQTDYASMVALHEKRMVADVELGVRRQNGEIRWLSVTAVPLPLDGYGVVVAYLDMTQRKQTQQALEASQRQLSDILAGTRASIVSLRFYPDSTWQPDYYSAGTEEMFGFAPTEMMQSKWWECVVEADREAVILPRRALILQGKPAQIEYRFRHKDGSIRWIQSRHTSHWDAALGCWQVISIDTDITRLKETEATLKRYERIVSLASEGIALIDRTFTYRVVNPYYKKQSGLPESEIVGLTIAELMGQEVFDNQVRSRMERCLAGKTLQFEMWDTHPVLGTRYLNITYSPYHEEDGSISGAIIILHDITPLWQIEQSLCEVQERYYELLQSINGIVWEADALTGQITFVSQPAEALLGFPVEQWLDETDFWLNHLHPDDRNRLLIDGKNQLSQPGFYNFSYRMITASGQVRWFCDRITVQADAQGNPTIWRGLMTDITAEKEAEHQQAKLIAILESTPDCVAIIQANGFFSYMNRAGRQLLGLEPTDEISQIHYLRAVPRHLHPLVLEEEIPRLLSRNYWMGESVMLTQDQQEIAISQMILVHRNDHGAIEFFSCIARDITALKRVEISLRLQAERERLITKITQHIRESLDLPEILQTTVDDVLEVLQSDRALIFQLHSDRQGQVVAEARVATSTPLGGSLYLSHCLESCTPNHCSLVAQHTYNAEQQPIADCVIACLLGLGAIAQLAVPIMVQGQPWGLIAVHQTEERHWQDWELELLEAIANQLSIAIQQSLLYGQLQQFNTRLAAEVQDQTAQLRQALNFEALLKRITDKVRDSLDEHQILQTVVDELGAGLEVWCCDTGIYDAEGLTSTISYEFTYEIEGIKGLKFTLAESTHPEIYPILFQGHSCLFCDISSTGLRVQQHQLSVLASPIRDDQGVLGDLWLFKDRECVFEPMEVRLVEQLTNHCAIALRQARLYESAQTQVRELERLNLLKDDFLNTVSHELRTPMSNMKMAMQMLSILLTQAGLLGQRDELEPLSSKGTKDRLTQYFQILETECQREISLINDLLDLSRLEAEVEPLMVQAIDLPSWIRAIAEPFEQRIQEQQCRLDIHTPPSFPAIHTDLGYLERILTELLNNACKYTPAHELIRIRLVQLGDRMKLCIRNTGTTIPTAEIAHVFDKFYRLPNSDPWKHGGTGLGLALVKRLIERLHGSILAQSGSTYTEFVMYLPLNLTPELAEAEDA